MAAEERRRTASASNGAGRDRAKNGGRGSARGGKASSSKAAARPSTAASGSKSPAKRATANGRSTTRQASSARENRRRSGNESANGQGGRKGQASRSSAGASETPGGLSGLVQRRLDSWTLDSIDPEFARRQRHLWNFVQDHYFRMEVEGWHRLPDPPALVVGVHAAGIFPVEAWMFGLQWNRRFGEKRILHGTAHDALIATPLVGDYFRRMGVMSASPDKVSTALEAGRDVAVYPGGDIDSLRPWTKRDEVMLAGRRGFVKMAIRAGVPIVPLAASGGMDTMFTLPGGRTIARAAGLKRLARVESMPLALGLPWGIAPGVVPFLPLPAKLRAELLDPLFVDDDPERADDDEYVDMVYREVEWRIRQGVDRLARRRSFPIFG